MNKTILLIFLAFLTACTLFEAQEPLPIYTLETCQYERTHGFSTSINVDEPLSEPSLDTTRISLKPTPYQQDYIANGAWPERLPKVFQSRLIEGLSQKWGAQNVNRPSDGVDAQYILSSTIQDFSVTHYPGKMPEVNIEVTFKLVSLKERTVVAAKTFVQKTPIQVFTILGIVRTFSQSTQDLIGKVGFWVESYFIKYNKAMDI